MSSATVYRAGDLFGALYRFDLAGEGIKMHAHTERDRQHNVTVLDGAVLIRGDGWDHTLTTANRPFEIADDRPHEIVALLSGTVILNLNLYGVPEVFKDERDGADVGPVDFVGYPDGR